MNLRSSLGAVALVAVLAAPVLAQGFDVVPAQRGYTSIAGHPNALPIPNVSNCDDCTGRINLSFVFPWFATMRNSLRVSSNGAININSTNTLCCLPIPLSNATPGRISFAQEDLRPSSGGSTLYLDTGNSLIVSFEGVPFFANSGQVNAQVELFANGDIEIRYGTMNGAGNNIAAGIAANAGFTSPMPVLPEFNEVGVTSGSVLPQDTGVLFRRQAPNWERNSNAARYTFDGVEGTIFEQAQTTVCGNVFVDSTLDSNIPGTLFDIALIVGAGLPRFAVTGGDQIFNINPFASFWLNGPLAPNFLPFAPISIGVGASNPIDITGQAFLLNPASADGFVASQAPRFTVLSGPGTLQAGPTGDDSSVLANFSDCSGGVPFMGTTFTSIFLNSNGRLTFGASDTDFSATVSEALTDVPSAGHWTDLRPLATGTGGGTIDWIATPNDVTFNWNAVQYFGETATVDFSISIDTSGVIAMDVAGIMANPASGTSFSTGDAAWLGISGGNLLGATDPGLTAFAAGASGSNAAATDMIYDFLDSATLATSGGILPSVTALQAGAGVLTFTPNAGVPGSYNWAGQ